jgi:deazaflavin-dependent oxidoreductase (nitroreductase family)
MSEFETALIGDLRAHGGKVTSGPFLGRPMLILTTTGAKSGKRRETPLLYSRDGDAWVIVASNDGAPQNPAWYLNLLASPRVTIEVDGRTLDGVAYTADETARQRLYDRHAAAHPSFLDYPAMTSRLIPVVVVRQETSPITT